MTTTVPGTTLTAYNVDNAPRDADLLAKIGKYQLRRLAEAPALNFLTNEAIKAAYLSKPIEEQAKELAEALRLYDGGGRTKAPAPEKEEVTTPVSEMSADPPKREPRVSMPEPTAAEPKATLVREPSAMSDAALRIVTQLHQTIAAQEMTRTQEQANLLELHQATLRRVEELSDTVGLLTSLLLMMAEPVLGDTGDKLLKAALEEAQLLPLRLKNVTKGA